MTSEHDGRAPKTIWNLERVLLALTLVVAIGVGLDQHWSIADLTQQLQSTRHELTAAQTYRDGAIAQNFPTSIREYNAHVAALRAAADAYQAAKAAKGSDQLDTAIAAVTSARDELYAAADRFTDFVHRWRLVGEAFDEMLDGNVTQLQNSRREDNATGVQDTARRIANSAPDLATPLRVALDAASRPPTK